ncbi:hypothetical protein TNCV_2391491 [Trichonephila clavipes]|nr:hypothetical protein TNCV_2391491 [Trichonephila clavipes]
MEDDKFIMVLIIRRSPELWTIAKFRKIGKISRNINLQLFCELLDVIADNKWRKYQMIKCIDFCEVWFLPESIARVAAIVGDHRCHKPRH